MRVVIGSDHAGYHLKEQLKHTLDDLNLEYEDVGTDNPASVDYPDYAVKVASRVASGEFERGVLVCGTGLGMCITANKVHGVRAVTAHDVFSAEMARRHNNANVLTMGERVVGPGIADQVLRVWLATEFEGGRHGKRVDKITLVDDAR